MTTTWTDWPLAERQSPPGGPASEMHATLFGKWYGRDEQLGSRCTPGDFLSEQVSGSPVGVWTATTASSRLWIPPWASRLLVRVHMSINPLAGVESAYVGFARPKLGTVYGTEMRLWLQCVYEFFPSPVPGGEDIPMCVEDHPGADGWPLSGLHPKDSVIEIPEAMRDTEQVFSYEVRRDNATVGFVRVFNDARDAGTGHLHRHWLFLEAA